MLCVLYLELEYSKSLGCPESGVEQTGFFILKCESSIRIHHKEIHLNVVSFKRNPFSSLFLVYAEEVLDPIFDVVIFSGYVLIRANNIRSFLLMLN